MIIIQLAIYSINKLVICRFHSKMKVVLYTVFVSIGLCSSGAQRLRNVNKEPPRISPLINGCFEDKIGLTIRDLPKHFAEKDLFKMFSRFGKIESISVCLTKSL